MFSASLSYTCVMRCHNNRKNSFQNVSLTSDLMSRQEALYVFFISSCFECFCTNCRNHNTLIPSFSCSSYSTCSSSCPSPAPPPPLLLLTLSSFSYSFSSSSSFSCTSSSSGFPLPEVEAVPSSYSLSA